MSQFTNHTTRIRELIAQAIEDNITLSYPPEIIVHMEDHGHLIDLVTGQLIEHGAAHCIYPTTAAEAELYVATLNGNL
jgi:hypothetical protein